MRRADGSLLLQAVYSVTPHLLRGLVNYLQSVYTTFANGGGQPIEGEKLKARHARCAALERNQ